MAVGRLLWFLGKPAQFLRFIGNCLHSGVFLACKQLHIMGDIIAHSTGIPVISGAGGWSLPGRAKAENRCILLCFWFQIRLC
jgi:hypothetical protein